MLYFPAVECEIPYTQSPRKGFGEQSVVLGVRQRLLTVPIITEYDWKKSLFINTRRLHGWLRNKSVAMAARLSAEGWA